MRLQNVEQPIRRFGVAAGDGEIARFAFHNAFGNGAHPGRYERLASRHGFQNGHRIGFHVAGEHHHIHQGQQLRNIASRAGKDDRFLDTQFASESFQRWAGFTIAHNQEPGLGHCFANPGRGPQELFVILLRPQRRHDARHGRPGWQPQFILQGRARRAWTESLDIDPIRNDKHFFRWEFFDVAEVAAMLGRHADEAVGDGRERAIQPAHHVGPTGRVQGRQNHRHASGLGGQTPPKHAVAGAHGHHGIDLALFEQPREPRQHAQIVLASEQVRK